MSWQPTRTPPRFLFSASANYQAMKEEDATNADADPHSDTSALGRRIRFVRFLQWLRFWKRHMRTYAEYPRGRGILQEASDPPETCAMDVTDLLSDEELETELDRILSLPSCPVNSDWAEMPQHVLQQAFEQQEQWCQEDRDESLSSSNQHVFVPKNFHIPLWKRLWRLLLGRKQRQGRPPLATTKDVTATSGSSTTDDHQNGIPLTLSPSTGGTTHFSVSTSKQQPPFYSPLVLPWMGSQESDAQDGRESIETVHAAKYWPTHLYVPQTGKEMADSLREFLERQEQQQESWKQQHPDTVDFDQIDPSDTKSLGSAALAVSFDNQEECAQLTFQAASHPHPTMPHMPTVEKQPTTMFTDNAGRDGDEDYYNGIDPFTWSELEFDDPPLEVLPSFSSSSSLSIEDEAFVSDYENNMGWSYDDAVGQSTSFSSLLSVGPLFEPICGDVVRDMNRNQRF